MPKLNELAAWWAPRGVSFACVYVLEAHACDEWPVAMAHRDVRQHRSLADRVAAATAFLADYPLAPELPLFADPAGEPFNAAYSSWPTRFWVLEPGEPGGVPRIVLKPMPKDARYDLAELEAWLLNYDAERPT